MSEIRVSRRIHEETPGPAGRTEVRSVDYVSKDRNVLVEGITIGDRGLLRRSEDNGETWDVVEELPLTEPLGDDLILDRVLPAVFSIDPATGALFRFFSTAQEKPSVPAWEYAKSPFWRTLRMYTQVSHDEGLTWSEPEQLVAQGDEYDEVHWMPGVVYGKNGVLLCGPRAIPGRNGTVIGATDGPRLFENGDLIDPNADPATANPDGAVEWLAGCLIGRWRPDGSGIDWTMGERFALPKKYSCDGAEEPGIDYLPDGRLFMGIRARTYPHTGQELPSMHYYALSDDDGMSWSEAEPLLYDDGSYAYAPACLINVVHSSKNDWLYVITNFADGPCVNCDPRNKLGIAEIDTETFRIKKDTVTMIATDDEKAGYPETTRFSNFRWYEDRETLNIVLFVTPCGPDGSGVTSHAFRHVIELPQA